MKLGPDITGILRQSFIECALADAVNPHRAKMWAEYNEEPYEPFTEKMIREELGDRAADAWFLMTCAIADFKKAAYDTTEGNLS